MKVEEAEETKNIWTGKRYTIKYRGIHEKGSGDSWDEISRTLFVNLLYIEVVNDQKMLSLFS